MAPKLCKLIGNWDWIYLFSAHPQKHSHLLNGEGGANHHDDDSKHHDGPGDESVPRVPVTPPTSRETEIRGSWEDERHWSGHQTPLERERGGVGI